jgi:hypothetical protein
MANEEGAKFVDTIRTKLQAIFAPPSSKQQTTEYREPASAWNVWKEVRNWYEEALRSPQSRREKYKKYRFLDENLPEASVALNAYADNIVSGTLGGEETYYVVIEDGTPKAEDIETLIADTEKRTGVKEQIWEIARDLNRDGDVFAEVVVAENGSDDYGIDKLKVLPTDTMFVDVDERGVVKDPAVPYYQLKDNFGDLANEANRIKFDWWRIIHFKVGSAVYGVDRGLFSKAAIRIGKQLIWMDDALVLNRASKAWMRYAYLIDTSGLSTDQAFDFVERFMDRVKRRDIIDRETGQISPTDSPLLPDEDIGLPVTGAGKTDIKQLFGDSNIGRIDDVYYLQNKFFMCVSLPKAYASIEEGTRSKATLTQLDVQFARAVRRRQNSLKPGLEQFYKLVFTLAHIDPESFKWSIEFPEMATADEMLKWEIEAVKANIAKAYAIDIGAVNTQYVLKELLGMDDDEILKYGTVAPDDVDATAENVRLPHDLAARIRRDPAIRAMLDDLNDIVAWREAREQATKDGHVVGITRDGDLKDKWK